MPFSSTPSTNTDDLLRKILRYIAYLRTQHKLQISLHAFQTFKGIFLDLTPLQVFNNHTNPYCMFDKSSRKGQATCQRCQAFVLHKCQTLDSFSGVCHAGVTELVYSVRYNRKAIGFVSISGYCSDRTPAVRTNPKYDFYHNCLQNEKLPKELCDAVIPPLVLMLESLYQNWYKSHAVNGEVDTVHKETNRQLLAYISEHYTHLTLSDLAQAFHISPSAISHSFKKDNGMTLKSYCNLFKIKDACSMLETSDVPISDIAYAAGFESLSYFINVFRKQTGYAPREYRKRFRSLQ